jgi:hypothetical protein
MALPGSTLTVLDGGLGVTAPASSRPHVVGVFESGTANVPTLIGNQRQLKDTFGTNGPGNDCAGYILDLSGGPIVVTRTAATVAASYGQASMASSISPGANNAIATVVATSAPKINAQIAVTIIATTGVLAGTTFQYSLDGGLTFSPTIAAAATVALGTSGITLEFGSGVTNVYAVGAQYTGTAFAPHYNATDLGNAFAGIDAAASAPSFDFFVFAGEAATASAAATLFSTIATKMSSYATSLDRYYRAIMGAGEGIASLAVTAFSALTSVHVAVMYGKFRSAPAFAAVGRGLPLHPALHAAAMRAAGNVISTDLAQASGAQSVGPLPGASALTHDEYRTPGGLDDIKIGTLRTASNDEGIFITNVWLKSPSGSDFQYWQHGRMMDQACRVVSREHWRLSSSSVVTKTDGTGQIQESSAQSVEKRVQRALDNEVGSAVRGVGPTVVDGGTGHVSDQRYQVDRTNNVLSTNTLIATIAIVPRGYLKTLTATISYKLAI